ncbi:hypothetical protein LTS10_009229 [Elasticomyces elasticus]|nr:hypothetical protein LTS10_009229 [Elasticomyces elasticus]
MSAALRTLRTQLPRNTRFFTTTRTMAAEGTHKSHATDSQSGSVVPEKAQEVLPKGVEEAVPDTLHDTNSSKDLSKGDSIVPKAVAESLPAGLQKAVPDAIHNTSGKSS